MKSRPFKNIFYKDKNPICHFSTPVHFLEKTLVLKSVHNQNSVCQSSLYENKVLSRNLPQLTLGEVPCFHKMKIVCTTLF